MGVGFLLKRRLLSGFFARRFVRVSGGLLTWAKPEDLKTGTSVSCRRLSGAVVKEARGELQFARLNAGQFVFIVYLAYDAREVSVEHVCLAAESEQDMHQWIHAIRIASGWLYYPLCMQPLPLRMSGLLVIELICIENILAGDWNGKSDPYILVEYEGSLARTATHYRKLTTYFNHVVSLPVFNDDPNMTINMYVFDEDSLSTDDLLGGLSVPLHALGFNKDIVWDSVPLRRMTGGLHGRASGTDQYGTISFRTLYRSSKLTQFLPKKQMPAVLSLCHNDSNIVSHKLREQASSLVLLEYERKVKQRSASIASLRASENEYGDATDEEEEDTASPRSGTTTTHSPQGGDSPLSSPQGKEEEKLMEFSIEMFKIQILRIVGFLKIFSLFKSLHYFLAWRDPLHTVLQYLWITWVCWIEPQSALMFFFVLLAKLLVQSHPCYPDLCRHLLGHDDTSDDSAGGSTSDATTTEFRVFECQRRRIAGAMTMLSTMVKVTTVVPAQMTVAAGTALASPLLPRDVKEEKITGRAEKVGQSAKKDLANLFINFSGKNLHHNQNEHEWVTISGVALKESPATVIDGLKIKWTVLTRRGGKKLTDKNGWEYAKSFPPCSNGTTSVQHDVKSPVWGAHLFSPKLKLHAHWVRRRVWVGRPIRPAFQSEEPIKLSEIVDAVEDKASDELVDEKKKRSLYAKFRQIMEEGKKLQNFLFGIASQLESVKNLCSWKSRWISSLVFWVLMMFLLLSILVSQFVVLWGLVTFVLIDQLVDAKRKMTLMQPLLEAIQAEVAGQTSLPSAWKKFLDKKLDSFFANMVEISLEIPVSVLLPLFQRACDKVWFPNAVVLTLEDLDTGVDVGGPLTMAILLERIYLAANQGDVDWWRSLKVTVHPKNLIRGHLVSDWEEYNPTSVFAKK